MMSLVTTRKRKEVNNPRSITRNKGKIRVIERSAAGSSSTKLPRVRNATPASRTFSNLRRGSIRIFSIFRNGKSVQHLDALRKQLLKHTGSVMSSGPRSSGSSSALNLSNSTQRAEIAEVSTKASLPDLADIPMTLPTLTSHRRSSSLIQLTSATGFDGESEPLLTLRSLRPTSLHTSKSTPGLSRQLTTKLSIALLHNNTVIHRPKLNSRPTVQTVDFTQVSSKRPSATTPSPPATHNVSILSSPVGSSNGPLSQSTAPTSFVSSGAPMSAERPSHNQTVALHNSLRGSPPLSEPPTDHSSSHLLIFPRQDAPRLTQPSVATTENAAAAKVYFETYFNQLLETKSSPRSLRLRQMERKLFAMALPNEQRQQRRREWYVAESYHLRQTRVLKSNTLARQTMKGVHVSNYEIVRILGKGSFGVVRLVREKSDHSGDLRCDEQRGDHPDSSRTTFDKLPSPPSRRIKQVFAMKVIRKSDMLRNSQEGHLRAERDFLVASENSRWVVPLVSAFQDNNNLYLVMEYMMGGDFLGLLLREDILDENVAKWYLAEMILCIEEAHRMNWIHRDVKPDNFLITASGHLKISDFGLAFDGHWMHNQTYYNEQRYSLLRDLDLHVEGDTQDVEEEKVRQDARQTIDLINGTSTARGPHEAKQNAANGPIIDWLNRTQRRQFAKSVVGTSQYMAPEVIRGENYDGRCDWWSIGIILYEVCPSSKCKDCTN